mmetsp:Transcript_39894/g.81706  ORF Transcript_39894/g.81706 Transcript_39894/m.81706 type:complete len:92 (-) Transcript_39894:154-429(-)
MSSSEESDALAGDALNWSCSVRVGALRSESTADCRSGSVKFSSSNLGPLVEDFDGLAPNREALDTPRAIGDLAPDGKFDITKVYSNLDSQS